MEAGLQQPSYILQPRSSAQTVASQTTAAPKMANSAAGTQTSQQQTPVKLRESKEVQVQEEVPKEKRKEAKTIETQTSCTLQSPPKAEEARKPAAIVDQGTQFYDEDFPTGSSEVKPKER